MKKTKVIKAIVNTLIFLILFCSVDIFFEMVYKTEDVVKNNFLYIIPSILVYTLFYGATLSISKNTKKTNLIISIIYFILLTVNHIKLLTSGNPLFISDFEMISNAGEIATLSFSTLANFSTYIPLIILSIIFIILNIVSNKVNIQLNEKIFSSKNRIAMSAICIMCLIVFFIPMKVKDEFLLGKIYKIENRKDFKAIIDSKMYYEQYGVIGGIIENLIENRRYTPKNYNENELKEELKLAKGSEEKIYGENPNIIVVFSEAFFDITKIDEVKFDIDVTLNFKELQSKGKLFNMISPSYGGLSSNVEYELLTGGNLSYFSNGYIPFNSLYKNKKSQTYPSIIRDLNDNGYYTKIVFGKDFYKSEKQYMNLGADSYEDVDNEEFYKGYFVSDEYLTDLIIDELNTKNSDPVFYFTATIQNHMPFCNDKYEEYDINVVESSLGKGETEFIQSYAQGIYDADKQLKRLYDYIQDYEEDTVLVFLGDHLPYISIEDKDVLADLSYFNTDDEILNVYRKYNTQGIVLTNFDVEDTEEVKYSSPDFLLNYVVNNIDIQISDYYKWVYDFQQDLPATNKFISFSNDEKIFLNQDLPNDLNEKYELRKNMQYMLFK